MPRTVHVLVPGLTALLLTGCLLQGFEPPKPPPVYEQHLQLGVIFEERGDWERAMQEYTAAAQQTDKGNLALGNLYAQRGNLPEAEKHFRLAMRTIRDDAKLYNSLAHLLLERKKNLEEAEELAQLSVKIGDQNQLGESWDTLVGIREARHGRDTAKETASTKTPSTATKETPAAPSPTATQATTSAAPKAPVAASVQGKTTPTASKKTAQTQPAQAAPHKTASSGTSRSTPAKATVKQTPAKPAKQPAKKTAVQTSKPAVKPPVKPSVKSPAKTTTAPAPKTVTPKTKPAPVAKPVQERAQKQPTPPVQSTTSGIGRTPQ